MCSYCPPKIYEKELEFGGRAVLDYIDIYDREGRIDVELEKGKYVFEFANERFRVLLKGQTIFERNIDPPIKFK